MQFCHVPHSEVPIKQEQLRMVNREQVYMKNCVVVSHTLGIDLVPQNPVCLHMPRVVHAGGGNTLS